MTAAFLPTHAEKERPGADVGYGVPAAAALSAATHGTALPAVGSQASPAGIPRAWRVWNFGSHLICGLTLDLFRRALG